MQRKDDDFAREIEAHIALEIERQVADGRTPEDARAAALKRFGNLTRSRERFYESRRVMWLEDLRRDIGYAVRSLRRNPGFAAVAMLTLALGIGANAAIFSLTDQVLVRTLPVPRPGELVLLDGPGPFQGFTRNDQGFSVPMFRGLQRASKPLMSGMFSRFSAVAAVSVGNAVERVPVELVSGDYFRALGVGASLGRTLGAEDDRTADAHPVVVVSDAYWRRRFAADAAVIGQSIQINGQPMTIVGVARSGFTGVDLGLPADLFVPLMMKGVVTPTWNELDTWRSRWVNVMGRLRPGVTREQAAAVLNVRYRQLLQEDVKTALLSSPARVRFLAKNLLVLPGARGRSTLREDFSAPLVALMGMVGVVLLIASANVANLLIARAATQQKEVAIRLALGAGRFRVVRQRLTESLVLAAGGVLAGLLMAWWTTGLLIEMLPFDGEARVLSSYPDLRVVLFAIGVATVTALIFGLGPALHATKRAVTVALRLETVRVIGGRGGGRVLRGLVVAQVALSLLLLAGAGLFAQSLYNLRSVDPGFVVGNLLQFRLDAASSGHTGARAPELARRLQEQLAALPGVTSASLARVPAMNNSLGLQTVKVQGYTAAETEDMSPGFNAVGPDYFATLGIPLVMGREFRAADGDGAPRVAIVNETMARYFWKDQNPLGRRFSRASETGDEIEVVGVVRDARFRSARDEVGRFFYLPYEQAGPVNTLTFYIRHRPGPEGLASAARQAVARLDPNLPIYDIRTMESQVDESLSLEQLVALLSTLFGALAMVLAAVGLYGVMSHAVAGRRREIGIRMALGAESATVLWLVLREVIVLAAAGVLLGLPATLGVGRLVESQLFGLAPTDPLTIAVAAFTLIAVAVIAGYLPARRAMRLDPVVALRSE